MIYVFPHPSHYHLHLATIARLLCFLSTLFIPLLINSIGGAKLVFSPKIQCLFSQARPPHFIPHATMLSVKFKGMPAITTMGSTYFQKGPPLTQFQLEEKLPLSSKLTSKVDSCS